jgi:hypothetical protein
MELYTLTSTLFLSFLVVFKYCAVSQKADPHRKLVIAEWHWYQHDHNSIEYAPNRRVQHKEYKWNTTDYNGFFTHNVHTLCSYPTVDHWDMLLTQAGEKSEL